MDYINPALVIPPKTQKSGTVSWRSPSNLALIKYWGKHGVQLPRNPSISFTLANAYTETTLSYESKERKTKDEERRTKDEGRSFEDIDLTFLFEGQAQEAFRLKQLKFLESIADIFPFLRQLNLRIESSNSFPHSAGIASSASSMSALALCLCSVERTLFGSFYDEDSFLRKASFIARLGSGSACRSVYPIMAVWGETPEVRGSSDLYAVPFVEDIHPVFSTYHDDILIASRGEKSVSSRAGHGLMEGNVFAESRYAQARSRMSSLLSALKSGDLEVFGQICEDEALTLHAMMMSSSPSFTLLRPNTLMLIERLRAFRQRTKLPVYFSLDAGPNLHVLYPDEVKALVGAFIRDELARYCENGEVIGDVVGSGAERVFI